MPASFCLVAPSVRQNSLDLGSVLVGCGSQALSVCEEQAEPSAEP